MIAVPRNTNLRLPNPPKIGFMRRWFSAGGLFVGGTLGGDPLVKRQITLDSLVTLALGLALGAAGAAFAGVADWTKLQGRVAVVEQQLHELRGEAKVFQGSIANIGADLRVMRSQLDDIRIAVIGSSRKEVVSPPGAH